MKKTIKKIAGMTFAIVLATNLSGCYASYHMVGDGGTYSGKTISEYDKKRKHWYLLWGAVPLDEVNANYLAGNSKDYTVREEFSFGDLAISAVTLGIAVPRTIRISKKEKD